MARANLLAAKAAVTDQVVNVASGKETSLAELATLLLEAMGSDLDPGYDPEHRVNAVPRRLASATRAERMEAA